MNSRMLILISVFLLGFIFHPALNEVHDYVWLTNYESCAVKLGELKDQGSMDARVKCVENDFTVKLLQVLLSRPKFVVRYWIPNI